MRAPKSKYYWWASMALLIAGMFDAHYWRPDGWLAVLTAGSCAFLGVASMITAAMAGAEMTRETE
jgi:hypothetical protein